MSPCYICGRRQEIEDEAARAPDLLLTVATGTPLRTPPVSCPPLSPAYISAAACTLIMLGLSRTLVLQPYAMLNASTVELFQQGWIQKFGARSAVSATRGRPPRWAEITIWQCVHLNMVQGVDISIALGAGM